MASNDRVRPIRIALLIIGSWVAVAALAGAAVYRIMKTESPVVEPAAAWEVPAGLPADPSDATVRDDLAPRAGPRRAADAVVAEEAEGETSRVAGAATESLAPHDAPAQMARQIARHRAAEVERQRAEAHRTFEQMIAGTASWSGLTPTVLNALTAVDIAAGLQQVEAMPWGPEANRALQGLLQRWAEIDPRAAADYALGLESNRAGSNALRSIWGSWAGQDPDAALDWYFRHAAAHPAMLAGSLRTAFTHLARKDMARALATAWQLPDAQSREALKAIVGQASEDGGLEALRSVVGGMAPGHQRNQMVAAIVNEYAVYRPDEAVRWINMLDDPVVRNSAVNQLVDVWGYDRPADAARWVAGIPDPALQGSTAATLMRNWSLTDPDEAGRWLAQLAPARPLDPALERYVRNTMTLDPADAMNFVSRITDAKRRDKMAMSVGRSWMARDAAQARAYFQASSWDAAIRNHFLRTTP